MNASFSQTLVEHLDCNKCFPRRHSRNIFPSTRDGAVRGRHHHEEMLKPMWPRPDLRELTFHVENKGGKSGCFHKLGRQGLHPIIGFLLENSFSIKDTLGLGVGQPLTHSIGSVILCQAVGPGPNAFISSAALTPKHSHFQKHWQLPKYEVISF